MMHTAYPAAQEFAAGVSVTIVGNPEKGGVLAIEYPDNSRDEASVIQCSANILEIEIKGMRWLLAPAEPGECVDPQTKLGEEPMTLWIVQS